MVAGTNGINPAGRPEDDVKLSQRLRGPALSAETRISRGAKIAILF